MKRLALALLIVILAVVSAPLPSTAQEAPSFRLGFRSLAQLIPAIVGVPIEDEHYGPNGDSLQRTTTGLMAWRKADNWTAFTDGATTWVHGPQGLQSRPNSIRFAWEADTPQVLGAQSREGLDLSFSRGPDGNWIGQGAVRNTGDVPQDFEVIVVAISASGLPIMDAPSVFLRDVSAGDSRPVTVRVPTSADVTSWKRELAVVPSSERESHSVDLGASRQLRISGPLLGAVQELRKVDGGEWLLRIAAERGTRVVQAQTDQGVLGSFEPRRNLVTISARLQDSSAWVRSTVLAHELQHVADTAAGVSPRSPEQCYKVETDAFKRQSEVWTELWQFDLPESSDRLHSEMNDIAYTVAHDPEGFASQLVRRYRSECGPLE